MTETYDWKAETRGLGWMILVIAERYRQAREHLGGDSELLWSAVHEAERYVNGPLRDRIDGGS